MSAMPIGATRLPLFSQKRSTLSSRPSPSGSESRSMSPAIGQGDELAVAAILDVVDVRQVDRQFPHREARHEHLHGRRVRDGDQRLAAARPVGPRIGPLPPSRAAR